MNRNNLDRLAEQYIVHSLNIRPGQTILIRYFGPEAYPLALACGDKVAAIGATSHLLDHTSATINRQRGLTEADFMRLGEEQLALCKQADAFLPIIDVGDQGKVKLTAQEKDWSATAKAPAISHMKTKPWLSVRAPTASFARLCGMTEEAFDQFFLNVTLRNYKKMQAAAAPLQKFMANACKIRVYSPQQNTDLIFTKKGIDAIICTGEHNNPDGEVYTAPEKYSVNGRIQFGPSQYEDQKFQYIRLRFENGYSVEAEAETKERNLALKQILNRVNARYTGEFAISFNPYILLPVGDILFDEKIDGAIHLAMGGCQAADNGNESPVHWDMVQIHRPEFGGGEIWIDDVLIRKDGIFLLPELEALNSTNLLKAMERPTPQAVAMQTPPST